MDVGMGACALVTVSPAWRRWRATAAPTVRHCVACERRERPDFFTNLSGCHFDCRIHDVRLLGSSNTPVITNDKLGSTCVYLCSTKELQIKRYKHINPVEMVVTLNVFPGQTKYSLHAFFFPVHDILYP